MRIILLIGLLFVGGAAAVAVLGTVILALVARRPKTLLSGISGFEREMKALAPEHPRSKASPNRAVQVVARDDTQPPSSTP